MPIQAITPGASLATTTLTFRCQNPACAQSMQPQTWTVAQVARQVFVQLQPFPSVTLQCLVCGAWELLNLALTAADADPTTPGKYADNAAWAAAVRALMRVVGLTPP